MKSFIINKSDCSSQWLHFYYFSFIFEENINVLYDVSIHKVFYVYFSRARKS